MPPPVRAKKRDDFYRDRRRRKVCAFCADKTESRSTTRRSTASAATCRSAPRSSRDARPAPAPDTSASWPSRSSAPATSPCSRTRRSTSGPEAAPPAPPEVIVGLLMLGGGAAAGVFGSLLGLGGGVLLVPLLTLGFGLPLREAVGVSLISVIVTSSAAAGVYLERHVANLRLGMTLELFTAIGALVGGSIAFLLDEQLLSLLFGGLLLYVGVDDGPRRAAGGRAGDDCRHGRSGRRPRASTAGPTTSRRATLDRLSGAGYRVRNLPARHRRGDGRGRGLGPARDRRRDRQGARSCTSRWACPFRVATATSNMMIGITAAASAVIYLIRGGIDPYVAGPTAIGVFLGATVGSRLGHRVDLRVPPPPVRRRPAVLAIQMLAARASDERHGPPDPGLHRRAPQRPPAHRLHLRLGRAARDRGRADDRQRHLAAGPAPTFDPGTLVASLLALEPAAFLWLGLLAVIAAPIGRVIVAGVATPRTRDWPMVVISLAILARHRHRRRHGHRWYRLGHGPPHPHRRLRDHPARARSCSRTASNGSGASSSWPRAPSGPCSPRSAPRCPRR